MAYSDDCCYLGRGDVYLKDYTEACSDGGFGSSFGLNFGSPEATKITTLGMLLGNVSDVTVSPQFRTVQKVFRRGNFDSPECTTKIITGVSVNMTLTCANADNLARAFCGKKTEHPVCTEVVTDQCYRPCEGIICQYDAIEFAKPGIDPDSVIITLDDGTPLVKGIDYDVDSFCVRFLKNLTLPVKTFLKISYTYDSKYICVEGMTGQGSPVSLTFKGCNAANDGKFYRLRLHKLYLDPVDSFSFISDDFQDINLTGTLEPVDKFKLKDSDISQWFEICTVNRGAKVA